MWRRQVIVVSAIGLIAGGSVAWAAGEPEAPVTDAADAASVSPERVRRQDGRVWIEGVRRPIAGNWRNRDLECLSVAVETAGWGVDYPTMMGLSGLAFRVRVLPRELFCPSTISPDYGPGGNARLAELGFVFDAVIATPADKDGVDPESPMGKAIVTSIDAGVPVSAPGPWWMGVVSGYERVEGQPLKLLLRTFEGKDNVMEARSPSKVIVPKQTVSLKPKQKADKALKYAVEQAETEAYGEYLSGFAALKAWQAFLIGPEGEGDDEAWAAQVKSHREDGGLQGANNYYLKTLHDSRLAAEACLRQLAPRRGAEAKLLLAAAVHYHEIAAKALALAESAPLDGDATHREQQAVGVGEILALEQRAVASLKAAADLTE